MKTFEEKWTAWIDGQLTGRELVDFEASLADKTAANVEKQSASKLSTLLKEHLGADVLKNENFFSHQIREAIQREQDSRDKSHHRGSGWSWWTVRRLVLSGATALAILTISAVALMRQHTPATPSGYLTEILNARVDPSATVSVFAARNDKVTVVWVEGLQSLPADYAAK